MTVALIDSRAGNRINNTLMKNGFTVIEIPPARDLPTPIAAHPDSLMTKIGETLILSADYYDDAAYVLSDIREYAPHIKIKLASEAYCKEYPYDAVFNALKIGNRLFCKQDTVSEGIKDEAKERGLEIISVKQGYPHCSVLAIDENTALTADEGMAIEMEKHGVKVYRISPGHIALPPYEYGFIGGACGVFGKKIYFFGDYRSHPSSAVFEKMAEDTGFMLVSLDTCELRDLGGIVFLDK